MSETKILQEIRDGIRQNRAEVETLEKTVMEFTAYFDGKTKEIEAAVERLTKMVAALHLCLNQHGGVQ